MKGSISNRVDTKTLSRKKKESHLVHKESQVKAFIHHSSNLCLLIKKARKGGLKELCIILRFFPISKSITGKIAFCL